MNGMIKGGWEYVIAAYSISAAVLLTYGLTLWLRLRVEARRAAALPSRDGALR
jgi:hypothetical protein